MVFRLSWKSVYQAGITFSDSEPYSTRDSSPHSEDEKTTSRSVCSSRVRGSRSGLRGTRPCASGHTGRETAGTNTQDFTLHLEINSRSTYFILIKTAHEAKAL